MNWTQGMFTLGLSMLVACGGGTSESAGSLAFGNNTSGTSLAATYRAAIDVQRGGISTNQISTAEIVQAVVTVSTSEGLPVEGVVVAFSQTSAVLLTFAPPAATALTDANGKAKLDIGATSASSTGAITVQAVAQIGSILATASQSIQITAAVPIASGPAAPPASINFVGAMPNATAIAIKGSGGNGRSESALLTFRIIDAGNAPVVAAIIDFTLNENSGGATISPQFATSNSDGFVTVTVSSGTQPASIVVVAKSRTVLGVTTQSDSLIVSNSLVVSGHLEIVAGTYNLDGRETGATTTISAYASDIFGNPVADGLAINFQTDNGVVAYSTLGGCLTVSGTCQVPFRVQDPRGSGIATVRASVQVGTATTLVAQRQINMAGATGTSYMLIQPDGAVLTKVSLTNCIQAIELRLSDGNKLATAAGTTVASSFSSSGVVVAVKAGSPVLDQLASDFPPTDVGLEIDLTSASLVPACNPGGAVGESTGFFRVEMRSPGGVVVSQRVGLAYPQ